MLFLFCWDQILSIHNKFNLESYLFLGKGKTAEVFALSDSKVVKLYYPQFYERLFEVEENIVKNISLAGTPCPTYFGRMVIGNRTGLIFERIHARPSLEIIKKKPWMIHHYSNSLAQIHYKIHQTVSDFLPNQRSKFHAMVDFKKNLLGNRTERLHTYIDTLPEGNSVCHGEFHFKNLLHSNNKKIGIDWTNAYKGCYLGDVAITVLRLQLPLDTKNTSFIISLFYRRFQKIALTTYLKKYQSLDIYKLDSLEKWYPIVSVLLLSEGKTKQNKWLLNTIDTIF